MTLKQINKKNEQNRRARRRRKFWCNLRITFVKRIL